MVIMAPNVTVLQDLDMIWEMKINVAILEGEWIGFAIDLNNSYTILIGWNSKYNKK